MTDEEAWAELSASVRRALSVRKLELYRELAAIEECDDLDGRALVLAGGRIVAFRVGRAFVRSPHEYDDRFYIRVDSVERRGGLRDLVAELID